MQERPDPRLAAALQAQSVERNESALQRHANGAPRAARALTEAKDFAAREKKKALLDRAAGQGQLRGELKKSGAARQPGEFLDLRNLSPEQRQLVGTNQDQELLAMMMQHSAQVREQVAAKSTGSRPVSSPSKALEAEMNAKCLPARARKPESAGIARSLSPDMRGHVLKTGDAAAPSMSKHEVPDSGFLTGAMHVTSHPGLSYAGVIEGQPGPTVAVAGAVARPFNEHEHAGKGVTGAGLKHLEDQALQGLQINQENIMSSSGSLRRAARGESPSRSAPEPAPLTNIAVNRAIMTRGDSPAGGRPRSPEPKLKVQRPELLAPGGLKGSSVVPSNAGFNFEQRELQVASHPAAVAPVATSAVAKESHESTSGSKATAVQAADAAPVLGDNTAGASDQMSPAAHVVIPSVATAAAAG